MAVFKIERTKDFTVMSNYHLRDRGLTLKAKGLLSQMLSLPDEWDYTLRGLAYINKESIDAIRTAVLELEQQGYIVRRQGRDAKGKMAAVEYIIYERPQDPQPPCLDYPISDNPIPDIPISGFPGSENPTQLNKDIRNKDLSNTDVLNIHPSIRPANDDPMDAVDIYRDILKENIGYETLCEQNGASVQEIGEILELMLETVCSAKKTIRIGGEDKPAELVRSRMLKFDQSHVDYVLDALRGNTTSVRNIRSYLLTALYNAPSTIGSYYRNRVNHDFDGG